MHFGAFWAGSVRSKDISVRSGGWSSGKTGQFLNANLSTRRGALQIEGRDRQPKPGVEAINAQESVGHDDHQYPQETTVVVSYYAPPSWSDGT